MTCVRSVNQTFYLRYDELCFANICPCDSHDLFRPNIHLPVYLSFGATLIASGVEVCVFVCFVLFSVRRY